MYRDIFTNKWFIGGVAFLIVFAVACVFWYRYDTAADRKAAAETAELLRQWAAKKAAPNDKTEQVADAPAESTTSTAEKSISDTTPVTKNTEPTQAQNKTESPAKTSKSAKVRVSPHGFGPYPKVPVKKMGRVHWASFDNPEHELLARVQVKLYKQGIEAEGATYDRNGLIYSIVKGICYVEWDEIEYPDGHVEKYISSFTGHPDDTFIDDIEGNVYESDIPGYMKVYTYPDGGIDPYEFLDLQKE